MKKRILVFPCGAEVGLEIHQALRWSTRAELFGASSAASNHGKYVYENYFEGIPFVDAPGFISEINSIIVSNGIDFVFPAHDSVALKFAEAAGEIKCGVIGSPVDTCRVCRSKEKTYEFFRSKLDVPKVYKHFDKDLQFPVFVKPDVGQGSKGAALVGSVEELELLMKRGAGLIVMEHLPGNEFTVDCFTDRRGDLRFAGARKRERVVNGISVDTYPVEDERLLRIAETINGELRFRGAWFFQVKMRANGEPALLEAAPRVAGGMALFRNLGVNLPLLSVFDALDIDVKVARLSHELRMDRALINRYSSSLDYKNIYVDLDDTILVNGRVNPFVIALIYQAASKEKGIHLVTRHASDVRETLLKHRLENLFDSITRLKPGMSKAECIKAPSPIFIDDSFSERMDVAMKLNIPVFDTAMIESLLDWKA